MATPANAAAMDGWAKKKKAIADSPDSADSVQNFCRMKIMKKLRHTHALHSAGV
jgi:hypothetical protein